MNPPTRPAGADELPAQRPARRTARFLVLLVTVLLVGNAILGDRGYLSLIRAADEVEQLSQSIAAVQARNDALRENARQLREEAWRIEELARGELGLMQPGEKLFIITDRPPATAADVGEAAEVAEAAPPRSRRSLRRRTRELLPGWLGAKRSRQATIGGPAPLRPEPSRVPERGPARCVPGARSP